MPEDKVKQMTYEEQIALWKSQGYKTTGINTGRGEENFADYGNAIDKDLQNIIINSYDDEEGDAYIRDTIATIYQRSNYYNHKQFASAVKSMGLKVDYSSYNTNYISDAKAHNGHGVDTHGNITIVTVTDPKTGAKITFADTNGNGALEFEEFRMAEILTGVAYDVNARQTNFSTGDSSSSVTNSIDKTDDIQKEEDEKPKVSEREFNALFEKYYNNGNTEKGAKLLAQIELGVDMDYTGNAVKNRGAKKSDAKNTYENAKTKFEKAKKAKNKDNTNTKQLLTAAEEEYKKAYEEYKKAS